MIHFSAVDNKRRKKNLIKPIFDDALLKEGDDDVDFMIYLHANEGRIMASGLERRDGRASERGASNAQSGRLPMTMMNLFLSLDEN